MSMEIKLIENFELESFDRNPTHFMTYAEEGFSPLNKIAEYLGIEIDEEFIGKAYECNRLNNSFLLSKKPSLSIVPRGIVRNKDYSSEMVSAVLVDWWNKVGSYLSEDIIVMDLFIPFENENLGRGIDDFTTHMMDSHRQVQKLLKIKI